MFKANSLQAHDVTMSNSNFEQVHEDRISTFYIKNGIRIGSAWHFVSNIGAKNVKKIENTSD
jgi:hypothetical protein